LLFSAALIVITRVFAFYEHNLQHGRQCMTVAPDHKIVSTKALE